MLANAEGQARYRLGNVDLGTRGIGFTLQELPSLCPDSDVCIQSRQAAPLIAVSSTDTAWILLAFLRIWQTDTSGTEKELLDRIQLQ